MSNYGIGAYADMSDLGQAALLHEYAHHYMMSNRAAAYPAWYVEGFAEYFMTATFKPEAIEFGRFSDARADWLSDGVWLPLEVVLRQDVDGRRRDRVAMFYAQSWLMTHYFFGAPGQAPKLRAYLTAVAAGEDPVKAFAIHVTPDFSGFQSSLKAYLRSKDFVSVTVKRTPQEPAIVKVTKAPSGADSLLLPLNRLMLDQAATKEARSVTIMRAIARASDSPLAPRARALLAVRNGELAEAIRQLDTLLSERPNDAELLLWRAAALPSTTQSERLEARRFLARAFKVNPDDWRILRLYALVNGLREGPLSETDLNVIRRAHELAPHVPEVVIDYATALVQLGQFKAADTVLVPLANSVHDEKSRVLAIALRQAAQRNDRASFLQSLNSQLVVE